MEIMPVMAEARLSPVVGCMILIKIYGVLSNIYAL